MVYIEPPKTMISQCVCVCVCVCVRARAQLHPTLCNLTDYNLPAIKTMIYLHI